MLNCNLVRSLITTAESADSRESAYLCLWLAFEHIGFSLAMKAGRRPTYALRQNGTLRTHTVQGYKMPDLIPIPITKLLDHCVEALSTEQKSAVLQHPAIAYLCERSPLYEGRKLSRSSYNQKLSGVLDLANTLDSRFPVWAPLDAELIASAGLGADDLDKGVRAIIDVLETIHRNLTSFGFAESASTPDLLMHGTALLHFVLEAYDMCKT